LTIITKKKKKGVNNSISKSIVIPPNKSLSLTSNENSFYKLKFEDISYNQIDLYFLKHLRIIPIKYKKKGKKYLKTLLELQHFYVDNSTIRVIKVSEDGKYLSVGLQNGKIKLYEIIGFDYNKFLLSYNKENIMEYLNFVKEKAYKSLEGHKEDVIDLSWSPFYYYLLLSSSVDGYVILWNVNLEEQKAKIECFNHEKIVTSVSFSPTEKSIFITGCLDKIIRIWDISSLLDENDSKNINQKKFDINEKYNKDYFNIEEKITSLNYFPSGDGMAIGTHNGKLIIYELKGDKYFYKGSFSCKNRIGKNSFGKKITSIEFLNKNYAIISSCDSRIRLLSMNDGKIIHKYKGYLNENSMIKSCIDYNYDIYEKYNKDYFNIEEKITSINYFPTGDGIAIGTHNGKLIIYELKGDKYFYKASYSCKNRIGKNSFGKKITSIEFVNKNYGIISSCDSRIRLLSMNDGKIIYKYKGYLNENSMIKSCIDYNYDISYSIY
jgi:WD40 repeat protein